MKSNDETVIICSTLVITCSLENINKTKKQPRKRKLWVKKWLREHYEKSAYHDILNELKESDLENFRRFLWMNTNTFQVICFFLL